MMSAVISYRPPGAALWQKARHIMDVILNIGAHRTATTSFQTYMRANAAVLHRQRVGFWGPLRTRNGILSGVIPVPGRASADRQLNLARGRIAINCDRANSDGVRQLIVCDENMIGTPRHNLRNHALYPEIGPRMARFAEAFSGRVRRVSLSVRGQDSYWNSLLAYWVARGNRVPTAKDLDRLVSHPRRWCDVIRDLSNAMPGTEITVLPFEKFAGRPEARLQTMTGKLDDVPMKDARRRVNVSPDIMALRAALECSGRDASILGPGEGRWTPFDPAQISALREKYSDDLFWLRAGADGLATLIEESHPEQAGENPPEGWSTRGQDNDIEEGRVVRSR